RRRPSAGSRRHAAARHRRRHRAAAPRSRPRGDGGVPVVGGSPRRPRREPGRPAGLGQVASGAMSIDPLVTTDWLAKHLGDADLRVLDGSWHMPQLERDPRAEFAKAHVPGAAFFDIDAIADHSTDLPHMLPDAGAFAAAVGALGVGTGDRVVIYDVRGVVSAARVWWTFRAFGHDAVAVLDGGLPKWKAEGRPLESGEPEPVRRVFHATPRPSVVRDLAAVRDNL